MFLINLKKFARFKVSTRQLSEYVQGQSPEPKIREYFYYIDHQGMVSIPYC